MNAETQPAAPSRPVQAILGVVIVAVLVGLIFGYCRGTLGAEGSADRGIEWAWKHALVFALATGVPATLSIIPASRLMPAVVYWMVLMVCGIAGFKAGGAWIHRESVLAALIEGLVTGVAAGIGVAFLLPRLLGSGKTEQKQPDQTGSE